MADSSPKTRSNKNKQRGRALRDFNETIRQADAKAIKLFDLLNDQTRHQFEFAILLHRIVVGASLIVLATSLVIIFIPATNSFLQIFSLIGTPTSLLTLLIAFLRNPIVQQYRTFESIFRLNVIFLNFIHRVQNAGLLLEHAITEGEQTELDKLYALIKDFENIEDDTLEKLGKTDSN